VNGPLEFQKRSQLLIAEHMQFIEQRKAIDNNPASSADTLQETSAPPLNQKQLRRRAARRDRTAMTLRPRILQTARSAPINHPQSLVIRHLPTQDRKSVV